jgi:hypothetical protein
MKRRALLFALGLLAGLTGGYFYFRQRPPAPAPAVSPGSPATPDPVPAPAEVPIQEGKTIDFSSGQPEIRETDEDRAALEIAKREMDEATKDITFAPTKPAEKK